MQYFDNHFRNLKSLQKRLLLSNSEVYPKSDRKNIFMCSGISICVSNDVYSEKLNHASDNQVCTTSIRRTEVKSDNQNYIQLQFERGKATSISKSVTLPSNSTRTIETSKHPCSTGNSGTG